MRVVFEHRVSAINVLICAARALCKCPSRETSPLFSVTIWQPTKRTTTYGRDVKTQPHINRSEREEEGRCCLLIRRVEGCQISRAVYIVMLQ